MPSTSEIVDFDAVLGPPRKVKLGGTVYTLPNDLPVELYLQLNAANKTDVAEDSDEISSLYGLLLELFQVHQPRLAKLPIGLRGLVLLLPTVYVDGGLGAAEGKAPAPAKTPPTRARRGSTSTSRKTRTPSRSSRS